MTNEEVRQLISQAIEEGWIELSLRSNELSQLPPEIGQLNNLTTLNLRFNALSQLPPEIGQLANLTHLDLRFNALSQLPPEIGQLANLTHLDLADNELSQLPPEIGQLANLTHLDLRSNELSQLPPEIGQLAKLDTLNLRFNALSQLPPEIGQLANLTHLSLANNELSQLPPEIVQLNNLSQLSLRSNELSQLPPEVTQLSTLTELNLANNELSQLPPEIGQLTKLITLFLHNNKLSQLPPEIGQLNNLKHLNLGNNELNQLPPEISQLSNLIALNLVNNELSQLPLEIGQLANLVQLNLKSNKLSQLPPEISQLANLIVLGLHNNKLSQLPPEISQLSNLIALDLQNNKLSQLPPEIAQLANLLFIDLADNKLSQLPPEIAQLTKLVLINLKNNKLSQLPPEIAQLTKLFLIDLADNKLSQLPPEISQLANLIALDLKNNKLSQLPPEISQLANLIVLNLVNNELSQLPPEIAQLSTLTELNLSNNPLTSPPLELARQGIRAIRQYFNSLDEESRILNEVKVLLVGEGGAGKTSLVKQILGQEFDPNELATHGILIQNWPIDRATHPLKVNLWDFGGQEIMHATHQFFLSKRSLYILVLDGRRDERAEYWLQHIESFGGESPVLVVLNKIDQQPAYNVSQKFLQQKYPNIQDFFTVSCATGEGLSNFTSALKETLTQIDLLETRWPNSWFNIKTHLETHAEPYISFEQYERLCAEAGITEPISQEVLVDFLHDLGVILHFREFELEDTHVLDPHWVTTAVYRIVNAKQLAQQHGVLHLSSLKTILKQDTGDYSYPRSKYRYIIDMMKKFELCYDLDMHTVLIPQALDVNEPAFEFDETTALKFALHYYDFLPPSILPRFIVKRHQDIKGELRWRTGVVLENETFGATAVVRADVEAKKIYIAVNGQNRQDYLAVIRLFFKEINDSFEKLRVAELVPMPDDPDVTANYQTLMRYVRKGLDEYIPDDSEQVYDPRELLGLVDFAGEGDDPLAKILELLRKLEPESTIEEEETFLDIANRVLELKPNAAGVGVNINGLYEVYKERRKKRK